jgi:predicted metal-dependent hydrolase
MATIEQRINDTDLSNLVEPSLNALDWEDFNRGVDLFNSGQFWESHEAWEEVWKRHPENNRIFFQGLIQVAAGLHQLQREIYHGTDKHFRNALWKLRPFQPIFLGLDVGLLVAAVEASHAQLLQLGRHRLSEFNRNLIPKIRQVSAS